ncbi:MAG: LytTR family DNA-binding domain-containing protein [Lachnospiraceae bacterium]|nr:LytTR family DNA-binding domain-containing protein [Lachnospiraceae bacterium]
MNILICDDEQAYVDALSLHVSEYMKNRSIVCQITEATEPLQVLTRQDSFDLAFLDIQMEGMDGITLAKKLRERNGKLALFFITNYDEYQDEAMDLQAFRFFPKPFDVNRLYSGLDKAMEYIDQSCVDIYLLRDSTHQCILADDILYITVENRKTRVQTLTCTYYARDRFDDLCSKLPALYFYLVHKSFFINLHYVDSYSYTELYLTDSTRIPVAPRKQAAFHKYWYEYLRRH